MTTTARTGFSGPLAAALGGPEYADALTALLLPSDSALPVPPATDREVWEGESGRADRATLRDVLARAEADLASAWPVPLASAAARVHRDGDRESWEPVASARERRLSRAAIAAASTLEDRWIDEVANGVQLLCEQSSWCWPAHDDTFRRHGSVLATVTDPFVDLGAGEAVGQLAWIDHLLGTPLDIRYPGLRARMRHEARARVLDPFLRRRDWHWLGLDGHVHNWNPWIHGNILVAALRFLDATNDAHERARIVAMTIEGIDRYVASLPQDGAIDEGYSYWWNGACRAIEALDLLALATEGRMDPLPQVRALRESIAFPYLMQLGDDWYVNLADGSARPSADQPWHSLHRAAIRVGDNRAQAHAASHRVPGAPVASEVEGLGRLLRGMTDTAWLAAQPTAPPLPAAVWLPSTQMMLSRKRGGSSRGLAVVAKGGHNGENHNHNDVGSFIVASDGVPVIVDAGRPTYTLQTFGPERYSIWSMQSSWHNVPEVRGIAQGVGQEFGAREVNFDDELDLELAAAYPVPALRSWRRRVRLDRERACATITDSWSLDPWDGVEPEPPTVVHLLIAGTVHFERDAAGVAPLDGATPVRVAWDAAVPVTATVRRLDDPALSEVWGEYLTRIELDVTERKTLSVTVELDTPTDEDDR